MPSESLQVQSPQAQAQFTPSKPDSHQLEQIQDFEAKLLHHAKKIESESSDLDRPEFFSREDEKEMVTILMQLGEINETPLERENVIYRLRALMHAVGKIVDEYAFSKYEESFQDRLEAKHSTDKTASLNRLKGSNYLVAALVPTALALVGAIVGGNFQKGAEAIRQLAPTAAQGTGSFIEASTQDPMFKQRTLLQMDQDHRQKLGGLEQLPEKTSRLISELARSLEATFRKAIGG